MNQQKSVSEQREKPVSDEVLHIGHTMTRMRLMIGRRVIGRMAIAKLAPGLELSHIDVLDVVHRAKGAATVGSIAEGMRIDPSRGSRVVADMVSRGLLQREVCQDDGRRSVIGITPLGNSILEEMRSAKLALVSEVVSDWPLEDVAEFARLFDKFIGRFETRLTPDAAMREDGNTRAE
ncbi:winged helix-turn-helix transcriptional regulator [Agrobacterium larrymoorei]|uniref:MarR family winged helix-turn-helix transcriptional regulator n=1 Tax=Agrobacterium larrymoorei TaxID=160699 RepID=UPI0015748C53|nr:MarR family winged helix-turn-helix transcriptional regulator [Agrobacterium larrymoorei]NTJ41584.1 winged helix-turn-helix transcriptional regulator [Agrobacterium larrymoorei]